MQKGEETLLHTSILHCITSRFYPGPGGNYAYGIEHSYSAADDFLRLG
jgi:hypothetical protein